MNKKKLTGIFFIAIVHFSVLAQDSSDSLRSNYIQRFEQKMYIKPQINNRSLSLQLVDPQENIKVNYLPNNQGYIGFGTFLLGLGFEFSFKIPKALQQNTVKFGTTNAFDFRVNLYGEKSNFEGAIQRYKRFYVSNPADIFPEWENGDIHPQRSDLVLSSFFLSAIHVFNHQRFSFRSIYNHAERQIKSAGSFLISSSFTASLIKSDSALVPKIIRDSFGENGFIKRGSFLTLDIMPGYGYNLTFLKNFYLNLALFLGPGIQLQIYNVTFYRIKAIALIPKTTLRGGIGYDNNRFFGGITFIGNILSTNVNNAINVNSQTSIFKLFIGYRFTQPTFLSKLERNLKKRILKIE